MLDRCLLAWESKSGAAASMWCICPRVAEFHSFAERLAMFVGPSLGLEHALALAWRPRWV